MASLTEIPVELLSLVLEWLPPLSLSRLGRVSSLLNTLTRCLLFDRIALESPSQVSALTGSLSVSPSLGLLVHHLSFSKMDSRWDFFVDRALSSLLPLCPNLLSLDLDDCRLLTRKSILLIAKHCLSLQVLTLSDCARLGDEDIPPIAMFLPDLQVLDLSKLYLLSDEAVTVIARSPRLTKLQVLNLAGTRITADSLIALSRGNQIKSLLSLDVSCCYNISVRVLEEAIAKKPKHLEIITDSIPHGQVRWEGMHSDASSSFGSHTGSDGLSDMGDSEDGLTVSSSSDWETASDASWESIASESVT